MIIPDTALPYILLQRTDIQRLNASRYPVIRRLPIGYEQTLLHLEAKWRTRAIATMFEKSLETDYHQLREFLPENAGNILDIGCGVAGIDAVLFNHYGRRSDIAFYLFDRTEVNAAAFKYGMGDSDRFYNSLQIARQLLSANGISLSSIHLIEAVPGVRFDYAAQFELVISLISWGYHYPLETYLEDVFACLRPGGRLVVDLRKNTGGEQMLSTRFARAKLIHADETHRRMLAIK